MPAGWANLPCRLGRALTPFSSAARIVAPGGLDEHHVVVKGQDGVAGLQRDGTLGHGGADAAAVHEADVRLIDGEEVEARGVGDEVGDGEF